MCSIKRSYNHSKQGKQFKDEVRSKRNRKRHYIDTLSNSS